MTVTREDFGGYLWPPETRDLALKTIIGGAPFARSLKRTPTSRAAVDYPLIDPAGADWVAEAAPLPNLALNPDAYLVAVAKLGGLVEVSNEALADASYDLEGQLGRALKDAFSSQLDVGLLTGAGAAANEPTGVVGIAAEVAEVGSLREAIAAAKGEIGDSGGEANTLALSATTAARESSAVAPGSGQLMYPAGLGTAVGLEVVQVPGLTQPLVYDSTRVELIVRDDFTVESSGHAGWQRDTTSLRVKGRFAVAVPSPLKAIRKLAAALA